MAQKIFSGQVLLRVVHICVFVKTIKGCNAEDFDKSFGFVCCLALRVRSISILGIGKGDRCFVAVLFPNLLYIIEV